LSPVLVEATATYMGTDWEIKVATTAGRQAEARVALDAAFAEIGRIDASMSEYDPESDLSRVNAQAGQAVRVPPDLAGLVARAVAWCDLSGGLFDVTFLPLGRIWDWRRVPFVPPSPGVVAEARALVGCHHVVTDDAAGTVRLLGPGMAIGLGAIAKGTALDRAQAVLSAAGFADTLADAGGEVLAHGRKNGAPWTAGVQDPRGARGSFLGSLPLTDEALATSGDYERFTESGGLRYSHILDPRTGWPCQGTAAVSVLARTAEDADALSTMLFVAGWDGAPSLLRKLPGVEALVISTSGEKWMTDRFERIFTPRATTGR
jgi:FAD:protein FMN transferase